MAGEFRPSIDFWLLAAFVKVLRPARFQTRTESLHHLQLYGHAQTNRWPGSVGTNTVQTREGRGIALFIL